MVHTLYTVCSTVWKTIFESDHFIWVFIVESECLSVSFTERWQLVVVVTATLPPYRAWGDGYGPIGIPRHNLSERVRVQSVYNEDSTQTHRLPDGMTPTDASPPPTDHFKDVLRVCHRVAILDGEMETAFFKTIERYLLDEMPVNADRPHTQMSIDQHDGFEAWDFITSGENHAHNARVRTRRRTRIGEYADVPHRENELKSLETKLRSGLEDDE
ncbi:Hypp655 [Branchiostoma lanceolatum]|uniref:Hypp655 protein n=1 Tax=Branchiostoma lanceolatum TaxID=7740 RepID=A0A8J9VCL0_BRALA|nr:Hypp655 [Branchiostoma lanceolatum]